MEGDLLAMLLKIQRSIDDLVARVESISVTVASVGEQLDSVESTINGKENQ